MFGSRKWILRSWWSLLIVVLNDSLQYTIFYDRNYRKTGKPYDFCGKYKVFFPVCLQNFVILRILGWKIIDKNLLALEMRFKVSFKYKKPHQSILVVYLLRTKCKYCNIFKQKFRNHSKFYTLGNSIKCNLPRFNANK